MLGVVEPADSPEEGGSAPALGPICRRSGSAAPRGRSRACWSSRIDGGLRSELTVLDHGEVLPDDADDMGGARGWARRWKLSMMIMRPPQHGQLRHGSGLTSSSAGSGADG